MQDKTIQLIKAAYAVLEAVQPMRMTVRQVYYQLVIQNIIANDDKKYKRVSRTLVDARKAGMIPWEWIEDRTREATIYQGYDNAREFVASQIDLSFYFRHPWQSRDLLIELWCEKNALKPFFEEYASRYYLTLNIGIGFDGWSSIDRAASRYRKYEHVKILYFGDFDASGEDMPRSLKDRLAERGCENLEVLKMALIQEDLDRYGLPEDVAKVTDSRTKKFVAKYGSDRTAELDALTPAQLRDRIHEAILTHADIDLFNESKRIQTLERAALAKIESSLKKSATRLITKELNGL